MKVFSLNNDNMTFEVNKIQANICCLHVTETNQLPLVLTKYSAFIGLSF